MFSFLNKKKQKTNLDPVMDVDVVVMKNRTIHNNISQLPKYLGIFDISSYPSLWNGVGNKVDFVILLKENREVIIVSTEAGLQMSKDIKTLQRNLEMHAFDCHEIMAVTLDLQKNLLGISNHEDVSDRMQRLKSEPMLRFRDWLSKAIEMESSDLHLETVDSRGFVRVRAHGEMWPLEDAMGGKYPADQIQETIGSIYQNLTQTSSNSTSIWKSDSDSYTMLNYELGGKLIKMRFQAISGHKGPKAIMRIFNGSDTPSKTLEQLDYEPSQITEIRKAQLTTSGLVCITGITGSGKTTTIRSFLETHPDNGSIIINTVEDPVELDIKGAHQKSVQRSFDDSEEEVRKKYIGSINAMLRGDIDIGMLGELRDSISANAWLNVAETGHMGIATLHAHRLTGIIPRLCNETMGLTREVLTTPQTINILMYQALVPKNCPVCAQTTDEILKDTSADIVTIQDNINDANQLGLDPTYFRWRNPNGCSVCRGRGTQGQTLVAELLTPDYKFLDLVRAGSESEAFDYHRSKGLFDLKSRDLNSRSIVEHSMLKVLDGHVDMRVLSRFEKMSDFVDNYKRLKGSV